MVHGEMTRSILYRRNPVWFGARKSLSTCSIPLLSEDGCGQIYDFTLCKTMGSGGGLPSVSGLWWRGGGAGHTSQCEMPKVMMVENDVHLGIPKFQSIAFQLALLPRKPGCSSLSLGM
jgi:hypothetical protein